MTDILTVGKVDEDGLVELSFSKAKNFLRCPKRFSYRYFDKLKRKTSSLPLRRGSWIHECLETHYQDGDWRIGFNRYKEETWDKMFEEETVEYGDLPGEVERIMEGYVKHYAEEDKDHKVIAVEQEFKVRFPGTRIVLTGLIDLITIDMMGVWVTDHKTMKNMPNEDFRLTDTQLSLYYWVVEQLKPQLGIPEDVKIAGVMFNYIRTKTPTEPELLKKGGLTRRKNIDCDYDTYYAAIEKYGLDPDDYKDMLDIVSKRQFYVRRQLPKSKAMLKGVLGDLLKIGQGILELNPQERHPRNFTKDCSWDCDYKNLCIAELHGHDTQFIIESEYEPYVKDDEDEEDEDVNN